MAKRGRPSTFKPEYNELAHKFCLLGATNADLATMFAVDERTIDRWISKKPEFCRTVKEGRKTADAAVAQRLYARALGYSHEAVKIFMPAGASAPVYAPYTEHYPPETAAAIFWLKNRDRERWRDRIDSEISGGMTITNAVDRPERETREAWVIRRSRELGIDPRLLGATAGTSD